MMSKRKSDTAIDDYIASEEYAKVKTEAARVHEEHLKNRGKRKKVAEAKSTTQQLDESFRQNVTIQFQDRDGLWRTILAGVPNMGPYILQGMRQAARLGRRARAIDSRGRVIDMLQGEDVNLERAREIVEAARRGDKELVHELVEKELTYRAIEALEVLKPIVANTIADVEDPYQECAKVRHEKDENYG
jgi:hypothetical protein